MTLQGFDKEEINDDSLETVKTNDRHNRQKKLELLEFHMKPSSNQVDDSRSFHVNK
jgi:hypothetical protein